MRDNPRLEKQVFVGFAGTITFGLFLGGWYMSSRILVAAKPPSVVRVELPAPPPPSEAEPETELAPVKARQVAPRAHETYLQLAAMGPHATQDYLKELAAKGIHPLVAPGPSENIQRILMGPYANATELKKAQSALAGQGIQAMVRIY